VFDSEKRAHMKEKCSGLLSSGLRAIVYCKIFASIHRDMHCCRRRNKTSARIWNNGVVDWISTLDM